MPLMLHDTLQRRKVAFTPRESGPITLYVCGPTVYSYAHIGNARPVVVFDVLQRLLRRLHPDRTVTYARNVTDVDDKINAAAAKEGVPISVVTDRFAAIYAADMAELGAEAPDLEPRATAHIAEMIDQIGRLVEAGAAYAAEGHVLFRVKSYKDYGKLSGRSLDDMLAGARVEVAPYKEDPADFVLWKPSKPGEPVWESPWGPGRPGWHIECSAMIESTLGFPVDIHGGGHDLIFPHHENEMAQGVCATHGERPQAYARYWMHNGFLSMDDEKMSKSLGNVLLVHELVKTTPGEALRWALLSGHYRAPLDWNAELVERSKKALDRLYGVLQDAGRMLGDTGASPATVAAGVGEALADDLNTPQAMAALFAAGDRLRAALNVNDRGEAISARAALLAEGALMGFLQGHPNAWFQGAADDDLSAKVEGLIAARAAARASKDWPAADHIRDELNALKVEVMDGPGGSATWRLKE